MWRGLYMGLYDGNVSRTQNWIRGNMCYKIISKGTLKVILNGTKKIAGFKRNKTYWFCKCNFIWGIWSCITVNEREDLVKTLSSERAVMSH